MAGKKHYHVEIRRNGAVYGTFGPYAKRSDALADAGSLGAPGVKVAVVSGSGSSCPSCPGKAPAKRRKNTSKRKVGDRVRVPQVDMRYVATIIKRGRAFPGGDVANLVEFGSGRTLWVHDDEVVYRKADNDPKPSKRRNTTKRRNTSKAANRRKSKRTSYNLPPPLARR